MSMQIKRIYAPPDSADGKRILVDRLWPRGVSKISARLDVWLKDIAPSTQLRQWFGTWMQILKSSAQNTQRSWIPIQ